MSYKWSNVVMYGFKLPYSLTDKRYFEDELDYDQQLLDNQWNYRDDDIGFVIDGRGGKYFVAGKVLHSTGEPDETYTHMGCKGFDPNKKRDVSGVRELLRQTLGNEAVKKETGLNIDELEPKFVVVTDDH